MRINTNNNGFVEIERTSYGISVANCDEQVMDRKIYLIFQDDDGTLNITLF